MKNLIEFATSLSKTFQSGQPIVATMENDVDFKLNQATTVSLQESLASLISKGVITSTESDLAAKYFTQFAGALAKGSQLDRTQKQTKNVIQGAALTMADGSFSHDPVAASLESFSNQDVNTFTIFSTAYAVAASKQSAFSELFFKTVVLDPTAASFDLEVSVVSSMEVTKGNINADPYKIVKNSLIKQVSNGFSLNKDLLRIYPVSKTETEGKLLSDLETTVTVGVDTFKTAPIKTGVEVDLLQLGMTTSLLANGSRDNTDQLDRKISLVGLYVKGTNSDASKSDYYKLPLNIPGLLDFVRVAAGEAHDMSLNTRFQLPISIKTLKDSVVGTETGAAGSLSDNYSVILDVTVSGLVSTLTGNIKLMKPDFTLLGVYDANGDNVTAQVSAIVTAIKDFIATFSFDGFDVKAFRINDNLRQQGLRITHNKIYVSYPVGYRAPIQIDSSVIALPGSQGDSALEQVTNITGIQADQAALEALINWKGVLNSIVNNAVINEANLSKTLGVVTEFVTPVFLTNAVDMKAITSNMSSKDLNKDISGALAITIKDMVNRLVVNSKIMDALKITIGGETVRVHIGVGTDIAPYINVNEIGLDSKQFEIVVESTNNKEFAGEIYISLSAKIDTPHILDRGWTVFSPEVAGKANITLDGAAKSVYIVRPRYEHINNMPVLGTITVSGLDNPGLGIVGRFKTL